jgi:hypothetical protein
MFAALAADRARVSLNYRLAPADPVRFALEKVHDDDFEMVFQTARSAYHTGFDLADSRAIQAKAFRAELAKILPVAEMKQWAELTDDALWPALQASYAELGREKAIQAFRASLPAYAPPPKHPDDAAVDRFAAAMKAKLAKKREEGRGGWNDPAQCSVEDLARMLVEHLPKGDPVDVANFAMMLFCREGGAEALKAASAAATAPRKVEVTPEVMKAFQKGWEAVNPQKSAEPGFEGFRTDDLAAFRAALAVANTQANARESEAVAEVERWREMSIANRDAFAAMRNAINEHIPIQSDEADLLAGPEFSVSCEAVARAVIAEVARLRDLVEQCERKIARKDAVLAHPEIQALLNKIGFGVEPGETEVERLRSLIGDDNIAALAEGRARIVPANQAPGMPHAACHACRIGDYCESADCPNARLEIERLEGELEQAEAQLDHANVELGLIVSERDALKVEVARLTKERDEAREKLASSCQALRDESDDYFTQLKATQAHAAKLEAMLTVPGIVGPVMLWRPFEQRFLFGWKDAEFSICFRPRDQSAHWMIWHAVGLELRQTPAPEAEEKRYRIRLFPPNAHIEFTTEPMTRADAEHFGEVIGPVN